MYFYIIIMLHSIIRMDKINGGALTYSERVMDVYVSKLHLHCLRYWRHSIIQTNAGLLLIPHPERISVKFQTKRNNFHTQKKIRWTCRLVFSRPKCVNVCVYQYAFINLCDKWNYSAWINTDIPTLLCRFYRLINVMAIKPRQSGIIMCNNNLGPT